MNNVLFEIDSRGVAFVTLNRPEKHNSFNPALVVELTRAWERASEDPRVRIVVLTGAGKSFCAGADLEHMRAMAGVGKEENFADALALGQCLRDLNQLSRPVIARVNGSAFGGGLGLIACADIAIATPESRFALTEVKLGIIPAVISSHVVRAIGARQARRLFMTAATFAAAEAQSIGLLHQVIAADQLDNAVEHEVQLLLKGAPNAQGAAKRLVDDVIGLAATAPANPEAHFARLLANIRAEPEAAAGIRAFFAKTRPPWEPGN